MSLVRRAASRPADRALLRLRELGIEVSERPEEQAPRLPKDITALDDTALMELFTQYTDWMNYIATQVALAETEERAAEESKSYDDAAAMLVTPVDKVTIAKAQRDTDPKVVEAKRDLMEKYAHRKMLSTMALNTERRLTVVSREITRRTGGHGAMLQGRQQKYGR